MDMANGMMDKDQNDLLHSTSQQTSKKEFSDHPLPTPPSNPPDTYDRIASPRQSEDPLSASPDLSHPAVVDAFTSDVRDDPPSPATQSPSHQPNHTSDIPHPDSSREFDRPRSEPPYSMDVDDKAPSTAMVNGHPGDGEYTAEDLFSGPAVESPEPTNEPTPPFTERPEGTLLPAPPSMVSGVEQAPDVLATSSRPKTHTPPSLQPPPLSTNTDIEMTGAAPSKAQSKPFHDHPTSGEPPAKRFKTDPSPTYDTSKKIPANQQKFLSALLRQVKKPKDALPFLQPVDPVKLNIPRYFDIITRPMDISTIEKKLNSGQYPVAQALVDDFNLMVNNCVTFNGPDNPITKMGRNIQAIFEKGMKTLPPETTPQPTKVPAPPAPSAPSAPPAPLSAPYSAPPKPNTPAAAPVRRTSAAFPPIRRESLTADGRPKREIKPPPERDIPMDKPRLRKKHAIELRFCQQIIKELQKKVHEPYSFPFLAPVDAVALNIPDYYKIIKQPMDLGTVETKLKEQQYANADEFYNDIKLIFRNCYKYNGPDSPVSGMAKQLEKVFDKKWLEKPEEPPEKPAAKRGLSSSPAREEDSSSDEDEIGRIQEQMTLMAKRLSEMQSRKKQRQHEKSPTLKGKGGKNKKPQRTSSGSSKPKKVKEHIPEVTFEQKRELSEKINFLSPSKMQGVLELIKDAMPLDSAQEEIELDIDILPPKTLHALYMYVVKDTRVPTTSSSGNAKGGNNKAAAKPKKKREVLSADAQNRKIAELQGMLDSYDKNKKPLAESDSDEESDDEISSDDSD